ncbi:MAG: cobalamin-dependent protein [Deltaproteobacteria bacterium]|nr:cobalamin-dependent protein [Candidatus Zymogenaceae bacterium]
MSGKKHRFITPYGDSVGDGAVQLSFTLPGVTGETAREAARRLAAKMGVDDAYVSACEDIGSGMSFIVLYGRTKHSIDAGEIEKYLADRRATPEDVPGMKIIDAMIKEKLGRHIVVLGACIESDAHTVGIDAIMNMKGYAGDYGLERYTNIDAVNLGAQVSIEELVRRAVERNADVLLISQVVTQKNVHIKNLTRLVELLEAEGVRDRLILVVGGPRISPELAKELGYDAGFGKETLPRHVAYFILNKLLESEKIS